MLKAQKTQLLIHLFDSLKMDRAIVFTKTKHGADRLTRKLKAANIRAEAIHGDKAQNQRTRALEAFRSGHSPILVATDVAARGLDIDDVTHVVNYDLPMEPEAYVHRIGRTARAGKSGHAVSFCDVEEKGLLKQVERLIKFEIPRERVPIEVPKSDEAAARVAIHGHAAARAAMGHEDAEIPPVVQTVRHAAPKPAQKTAPHSHREDRREDRRDPRASEAHAPRPQAPRTFAGPNARRPQPSERPHAETRDDRPRTQGGHAAHGGHGGHGGSRPHAQSGGAKKPGGFKPGSGARGGGGGSGVRGKRPTR